MVVDIDRTKGTRLGLIGTEVGLADLSLFVAGSCTVRSVEVETLCWSLFALSEVLEGFEMESKIAWNLRFVVLIAGILLAGRPKIGRLEKSMSSCVFSNPSM